MPSGCILALMLFVILFNVLTAMAAIALFAIGIWVAVDPMKMHAISAASGKTDIYAAAWIAIFAGFAYFVLACFGIYAALKKCRRLMLLFIGLMFIVYLFECASCITAVTNRDFLLGNSSQVKYQMLKYYSDSSDIGKDLTKLWDTVMQDGQCCGTDSAEDWMDYNSTFLVTYNKAYPWPLLCCKTKPGAGLVDPQGCILGVSTSLNSQGCFSYIQSQVNRYTWAISWYGFAVQILVFILLVLACIYTILLG